jgi:phosphoglucomutase
MTQSIESIQQKASTWLNSSVVDDQTKATIRQWMETDTKELTEAFYSDLEFGTGGLRGVMGVGTMRMNRYTVGMATQGLANYLKTQFSGDIHVAIAHDSRNNSPFFTQTAAQVLSANGIHVHLFSELRPTPLLSYAVRHLKAHAGIVITASHNPKEYNGYKVYWNDGAQVLPPNDKGIIAEVRKISSPDQVNFTGAAERIHAIGPEVEEAYQHDVSGLISAPEAIQRANNVSIVYTALHGAGITMVPKMLQNLGFANVTLVEEQAIPDGNFSTVQSPNPEEREALSMALSLADRIQADLVLGTDPDTDRVGLAIRDDRGQLMLLNGNQAACLLVYYQLKQWQSANRLNGGQYIAKTIVTTDLLSRMAADFNVECYETLTGFKYIAEVIREKEGKAVFIAGGEESYGYSAGEFVRDKDAVLSSVLFCEIAAWCKDNGTTMFEMLLEIYAKYGLFHEYLLSLTMKGLDGLERIQQMMAELRTTPPLHLGGSPVVEIRDVQNDTVTDLTSGKIKKLHLPSSNVLQFILEDGSKISARPSGTEPKIKFYFSLRTSFGQQDNYHTIAAHMQTRIDAICEALKLK